MSNGAPAAMEYGDTPSIVVVANGGSGRSLALRSAALAGSRVRVLVGIEEGLERLERQAGLDCALVHVERDHGPLLDRLLEHLRDQAEAGALRAVISAPASLIDVVAAKAWHPGVQHLCDADEIEQAAALRAAFERPRHRLHDVGREQDPPRLQPLSDEVRRIASAFERFSVDEEVKSEEAIEAANGIDAGFVRAIIRARRLREQFFGADLFADPAWDIMLDLLAARLENHRVAVSSLCIAAAVPATTALRWIKTLTDLGLLVRSADPQDGRRVYIELAEETAAALVAYLAAAQRIAPLNL